MSPGGQRQLIFQDVHLWVQRAAGASCLLRPTVIRHACCSTEFTRHGQVRYATATAMQWTVPTYK